MIRSLNKQMFSTRTSDPRKFGKLAFNPFQAKSPKQTRDLKSVIESVYKWAKQNGAKYYSFLPYPHTQGIAEKQQTFLDLNYKMGNLPQNIAFDKLKLSNVLKGEGDGSSFPNGGLRDTPTARGYLVWDWKSNLYIRKSNQVLYIPALLVNHYGEALDQKTLFRKAEEKLENQCVGLLNSLGIKAKKTFVGLGLEQQFFIIPENLYKQRIDLFQTGRALIGKMPPHHQQFSDHYYGRLQTIVQKILDDAESELFEMGVPVKTRHKEVAPNQFEFCSLFQDAGNAIDHNLLKLEVLKEKCLKYGYVALYHEKPFSKINGSGKHINWSLNYVQGDSKMRNLFNPQNSKDELFLLFTLIKLKAVLNNQKLYLASVCVPGNELRLGGHEAPPRIISAFLGKHVTNMLEKLPEAERLNLTEKIHQLVTDIPQEDTDRNRTSPYAYTSNRFEFRAVGSTQNCLFPTTVILSTIANQIEEAHKLVKQGMSVPELINRLVKQTVNIRFEGDGYSKQWVEEAKSKGLYVNTKFTENIENIKTDGNILVKTGVYSEKQLEAKYQISKQRYINTVLKEVETLLIILNKNIIPRALSFMKNNNSLNTSSDPIIRRMRKFENAFEKLLTEVESLEKSVKPDVQLTLGEAEEVRAKLGELDDITNQVTAFLPESKEWPELYDVLGKY